MTDGSKRSGESPQGGLSAAGRLGALLLIGGTGASMMLPGLYADLAMGLSLLGLLLVLWTWRHAAGD